MAVEKFVMLTLCLLEAQLVQDLIILERLTPKQAEAARTIARKDKTYHQGGSGFGHGELNHLNEVVVGGTITTE